MTYVIYFRDGNYKRVYAKDPQGSDNAYTDNKEEAFQFKDRHTAEVVGRMLEYEDELFEPRSIEEIY